MDNIFKRVGMFTLSAMLALTMCSASVFAVSGVADSDNTDYNTNRTANSTETRQANSNNTGTVRLGKILTVNQKNKFPNIEDFVFKITPIAAWDNANVATDKSGATISANDMPQPSTSGTSHHKITNIKPAVTGDDNSWCSLVSIGDFKNAEGENTSSETNSDAASNTDKIADKYRRTRTTDVTFTFTKAGYYMYRVDEVGSKQNGSEDGLSSLKKDVAGVDYDDNNYYIVFYVCNRQATADAKPNKYGQGTQKGDTIGQEGYLNKVNEDGTQTHEQSSNGVYVHTITSWTNQNKNEAASKEATDKKPDNSMRDSDALATAQNTLHDLMLLPDGETAKPNTGEVANDNNGVVDGPVEKSNGSNGAAGTTNKGVSTVTHDNLGKVGISVPTPPPTGFGGPNKLEAYRMWNDMTTHDVVLKKNVTGNLGDRTKQFVFEVELTGLEKNQTYTTNVPAGSTEDATELGGVGAATNDTTGNQAKHQGTATTSGIELYDMTGATIVDDNSGYPAFKTDDTTAATQSVKFKVKLRDDEILVLNSLPRSASYKVKEQASDHVAQYNIMSTNEDATNKAVFTEMGTTTNKNGKDENKNKTRLGVANTEPNKELSTKVEFVDRYDGTVTILFENNRDLATITGVAGLDYMVYVAIVALLTLAAIAIIKRRRMYSQEDIM